MPPNPSELLLDQKVTELFDEIGKRFEVIVIDTAPVGMVSDSLTLSKFADCTLYLVRQGHTFKKQITLIDELYRENKLPKVSIVVNDVKINPVTDTMAMAAMAMVTGMDTATRAATTMRKKAPMTFFEKFIASLDPRKWFGKRRGANRQKSYTSYADFSYRGAGFIGSNLVGQLLKDERVSLSAFSTTWLPALPVICRTTGSIPV